MVCLTLRPFYPPRNNLSTHWIEDCVGPITVHHETNFRWHEIEKIQEIISTFQSLLCGGRSALPENLQKILLSSLSPVITIGLNLVPLAAAPPPPPGRDNMFLFPQCQPQIFGMVFQRHIINQKILSIIREWFSVWLFEDAISALEAVMIWENSHVNG